MREGYQHDLSDTADCQSCMECCQTHHATLIGSCAAGAFEMREVCCPDEHRYRKV
eukprot:SAG25_NODE_7512_length_476_cov_0.811671_1_plen_54_part_10